MKNEPRLEGDEDELIASFSKISSEEQELLYKAPVLLSLLASISDNHLNPDQKAEAVKLSHLKTFTARPELINYYKTVEKRFAVNFELLEKQFYPFDPVQCIALKKEINRLYLLLRKMDNRISILLLHSLNGYAAHVKKSGVGILDDFIFPLPIKGLNS
ncbi:MAG TPA: hypothetical protein VNZ86_04060 [Bacteroidia bacterium]|jgi:hypothetical protein|nr:hypothetical protein [Bacteroidia bacterium]